VLGVRIGIGMKWRKRQWRMWRGAAANMASGKHQPVA